MSSYIINHTKTENIFGGHQKDYEKQVQKIIVDTTYKIKTAHMAMTLPSRGSM